MSLKIELDLPTASLKLKLDDMSRPLLSVWDRNTYILTITNCLLPAYLPTPAAALFIAQDTSHYLLKLYVLSSY